MKSIWRWFQQKREAKRQLERDRQTLLVVGALLQIKPVDDEEKAFLRQTVRNLLNKDAPNE